MAYEEDDLFDDDFDFVDEDSDVEAERDDDVADEPAPTKEKNTRPAPKKRRGRAAEKKEPVAASGDDGDDSNAPVDQADAAPEKETPSDERAEEPPQPVGPPTDRVVHIYEFGKYQRTINRPFTEEDAVSFSEEYSKTGKAYGRLAIPGPQDETPAQSFAEAANS